MLRFLFTCWWCVLNINVHRTKACVSVTVTTTETSSSSSSKTNESVMRHVTHIRQTDWCAVVCWNRVRIGIVRAASNRTRSSSIRRVFRIVASWLVSSCSVSYNLLAVPRVFSVFFFNSCLQVCRCHPIHRVIWRLCAQRYCTPVFQSVCVSALRSTSQTSFREFSFCTASAAARSIQFHVHMFGRCLRSYVCVYVCVWSETLLNTLYDTPKCRCYVCETSVSLCLALRFPKQQSTRDVFNILSMSTFAFLSSSWWCLSPPSSPSVLTDVGHVTSV